MMPRIRAFNPYTGRPVPCPSTHHFKPFKLPQRFVTVFRGLKKRSNMLFGAPPQWTKILGIGTNSAVNQYTMNTSRLDQNFDVAVIKLNTLTSPISSPYPQTRYWSFCFTSVFRFSSLAHASLVLSLNK